MEIVKSIPGLVLLLVLVVAGPSQPTRSIMITVPGG